MKIVFDTQVEENYGAHNWDGQGECPQYWKFKGGSTYVMPNVTSENLNDPAFMARVQAFCKAIAEDNNSFREYVINWEVLNDDEPHCEEWREDWVWRVYPRADHFLMRRAVEGNFMREEIGYNLFDDGVETGRYFHQIPMVSDGRGGLAYA